MKQIETDIIIEASPEKVWQVLTNYKGHSKWNPFIRSLSGGNKEGEKLTVFLQPPGAKGMTFHPEIMAFQPFKEFRWKGKLGMKGLFDGEHYFILEENSPKQTKFIHGELFNGILVAFMKGTLEKTQNGFQLMNAALKKECEKRPRVKVVKKKPSPKTVRKKKE